MAEAVTFRIVLGHVVVRDPANGQDRVLPPAVFNAIARCGEHMARCAACDQWFLTKRGNKTICSSECKARRHRQYRLKWRAKREAATPATA